LTVTLRVSELCKTYGGTRALHRVSLELYPGEVHALVGGNGSGKSTLIKVLAGSERADAGTVSTGGRTRPARFWTGSAATAAGLRFVHQEQVGFAELSVAENIALGRGYPTGALGRIRWAELRSYAREVLKRFDVPVDPETPMGLLRPADRTRVAIAQALQDVGRYRRAVLFLDEPTAALPGTDVDHLLADLRQLAANGLAIGYVSHRLDEVLRAADRVTVLRDGVVVSSDQAHGLTEAVLGRLIAGRPVDALIPPAGGPSGAVAVEAAGLTGGAIQGVDVSVRRGEVLGIAGLLGSGRSTLLRMLFGAAPVTAGEIRIGGRPVRLRGPADAMRAGIAYLPEDRQADGMFPDASVRHNVSAARVGRYFRGLVLRHRREAADAAEAMRRFGIRAGDDRQPVRALSGGNQQKVLVARWLLDPPEVLLLDEPTHGVDVATRGDIFEAVRVARDAGTAVVLVSSDLAELTTFCDRVAVLRGGRVIATLDKPRDDLHRLTELVKGGKVLVGPDEVAL